MLYWPCDGCIGSFPQEKGNDRLLLRGRSLQFDQSSKEWEFVFSTSYRLRPHYCDHLPSLASLKYRVDRNIRWGGTKTCSTPTKSPNRWADLVIWGIILYLRAIQFTSLMRFLDFHLSSEKMTTKVRGSTTLGGQKIGKNFLLIFLLFFIELGGETS